MEITWTRPKRRSEERRYSFAYVKQSIWWIFDRVFLRGNLFDTVKNVNLTDIMHSKPSQLIDQDPFENGITK